MAGFALGQLDVTFIRRILAGLYHGYSCRMFEAVKVRDGHLDAAWAWAWIRYARCLVYGSEEVRGGREVVSSAR